LLEDYASLRDGVVAARGTVPLSGGEASPAG
jgi:hypothetical protein